MDIANSLNKSIDEISDNARSAISTSENSTSGDSTSDDIGTNNPECRICYKHIKKDGVKPCSCNSPVHKKCLIRWLRERDGEDVRYECEVCLNKFNQKKEYDYQGCLKDGCTDIRANCLQGNCFSWINKYVQHAMIIILAIIFTAVFVFFIALNDFDFNNNNGYGIIGGLLISFSISATSLIVYICNLYPDNDIEYHANHYTEYSSRCISLCIVSIILTSVTFLVIQLIGQVVYNLINYNDMTYEFYPGSLTFVYGLVTIACIVTVISTISLILYDIMNGIMIRYATYQDNATPDNGCMTMIRYCGHGYCFDWIGSSCTCIMILIIPIIMSAIITFMMIGHSVINDYGYLTPGSVITFFLLILIFFPHCIEGIQPSLYMRLCCCFIDCSYESEESTEQINSQMLSIYLVWIIVLSVIITITQLFGQLVYNIYEHDNALVDFYPTYFTFGIGLAMILIIMFCITFIGIVFILIGGLFFRCIKFWKHKLDDHTQQSQIISV